MKRIRIVLIAFVALVSGGGILLGFSLPAHADHNGNAIGMATFHGKGDAQEFAPDFIVWNGEFWGESVTDSESGPLHRGTWYCTGEQVLQGGTTVWAGGFCVVTDGDGDTVNLHWQSTKGYPGADIDTRGDYYSGTGKYAGITGNYLFHCESVAASHFFCSITGGKYNVR